MSFSNYLENEVLDHVTGKGAYTSPTNYVGLSSTTPNENGTGVTEPGAGAYARVTTSASDWNAASAGSIANANDLTFPTASADWVSGSNLTYVVVYDALTSGNMIYYGQLNTAKAVLNGDTAKIPAGSLTITLD
tara:strand:- start:3109 stop:3510 length:402 start_codon:yes stop_codon:yes gene_type:complete